MSITPNWKGSRTASKRAKLKLRREVKNDERVNKAEAKRRDGHRCRFPLCRCRIIGIRLESSHGQHKGMGGDPKGLRSDVENLISMCFTRHQDGIISRHKGTLKIEPLDAGLGYSGPVKWLVDLETLLNQGEWFRVHKLHAPTLKRKANAGTGLLEVARETAVQKLLPLEPWQRELLEAMAHLEV